MWQRKGEILAILLSVGVSVCVDVGVTGVIDADDYGGLLLLIGRVGICFRMLSLPALPSFVLNLCNVGVGKEKRSWS